MTKKRKRKKQQERHEDIMEDVGMPPRGRPPTRDWPEPIPDSPENVMRSLVESPPRAESDWKYLEETDE